MTDTCQGCGEERKLNAQQLCKDCTAILKEDPNAFSIMGPMEVQQ